MRGVTTAFLKLLGTKPSASEQLTSLVIEGNRMSANSLTIKVGQGSRVQDFEGEASITLLTCVSVTGENCSRMAGGLSGEGECRDWLLKPLCICVILSVKKELKRFAKDRSSVLSGKTVSDFLCKMLFSSFHSFLESPELLFIISV